MTRISENWDRGSVIGATSYVNIGKVTYHAPRGDRIVRKRLYVLGSCWRGSFPLLLSSSLWTVHERVRREARACLRQPSWYDCLMTRRRAEGGGAAASSRGNGVPLSRTNRTPLASHTPALTPHHLRCRDRFGFCYSSHGRARCAWRNGTRRRYKKTGRGSSRR